MASIASQRWLLGFIGFVLFCYNADAGKRGSLRNRISSSDDERPSAPSGSAGPSVGRAVRPRGGVRQRSRAVLDEEGIADLCVNERGSLVNELLRQWARADKATP